MKKIFYLFCIVVMGSLVASCHLNELPTFDDNDAFAAFTKSTMTIAENGGTLNIPVHVSSLGGVATTVTYEFVNGSAKQGVDFEDASGTGSISFSAGESEKNIVVKIIEHPGVFTGDRSFSVKFKSAGDTKIGANNVCNVTINDLDHPLSALFGTYTAKGTSYFSGPVEEEMTFMKDDSDVTKVWIDNLFCNSGWSGSDTMFYGIVNDDMTLITIPLGQETEYIRSSTGKPCLLLGCDDELNIYDSGNITVAIKEGGKRLEFLDLGPCLYLQNEGYASVMFGDIVCTK